MQSNACKVCGGSDMNLVDGYYYCVECGTQDANIQERIVDTDVFIGLATKTTRARVRKPKEKMNMSPEWCKWHAYNFIIAGLADELIAAGAEPTVKTKILWIWTKYIKLFKAEEEQPKSHFLTSGKADTPDNEENDQSKSKEINTSVKNIDDSDVNIEKDNVSEKSIDDNDSDIDQDEINDEGLDASEKNNDDNDSVISDEENVTERMRRMKSLIDNITKSLIIAIFYIALNLDKSDIQLSHLLRYIKWDYINITQSTKYIPKDLNIKNVPGFSTFRKSCNIPNRSHTIRRTAYALFKILNLGTPIVPDMRKIIEDTRKELCLPEDFKDLVVSLMYQYPTQFVKMTGGTGKRISIPDYEVLCLSYFAVAFKLCFGLDGEYEEQVSDVVDRINSENNYHKSLKIGSSSDATDRLFSFKDWCEHMRVKEIMVCKHNLQMARVFKYDVSDHVFVEHMDSLPKKPSTLVNEIVKDVLDRIPLQLNTAVIPKSEFDLKFTPMSSCVDVILDYIQDPEMRIALSEDFSQYSLEYATRKLRLIDEGSDSKNIITGVSENKNIIHGNAIGEMTTDEGAGGKMLYVRFCDNEDIPNTLTAGTSKDIDQSDFNSNRVRNESTIKNDGKVNDEETDKHVPIDHDATKMSSQDLSKFDDVIDNDQRTVTFVDYPNASIYDDDNKDDVKAAITVVNDSLGYFDNDRCFEDYKRHYLSNTQNETIDAYEQVPETIDRKALISKLIKNACQKYQIRLPVPPKRNNIAKKERRKARNKPRIAPNPEILFGSLISKKDSTIFSLLSSYYQNIQDKTNTEEKPNEDFQSIMDTSVQEDLEPVSEQNLDYDLNQSGVDKSMNDCQIQDDKVNNELEALLDSDIEESDEEYVLPEIAQEQSDVDLDKAAEKILERETDRCGAPPKKKIKMMEKKVTNESERFLHSSAWGVKKFNYWTRHYIATKFTKDIERHERFNFELHHNLPSNFVHVLRICGSVIDCSPFTLYKKIQSLERCIIKKMEFKK